MSALAGLVDKGLVAGPAEALALVDDWIEAMGAFLRTEVHAGHTYLPHGDHIMRAFSRRSPTSGCSSSDRTPTQRPGTQSGLSFSVAPDVRPLPKSLVNIYKEVVDDVGCEPPRNGDLSPWSAQGVMLLNRCLTVRPARRPRTAAAAGRRSPSGPSTCSPVGAARSPRSSGAGTHRP